MGLLSLILLLLVAAGCASLASALVPGRIPGGFFVAAIVGLLGAWLGTYLMGNFGPVLAGVALVPTIVGSGLLIFVLALVSGRRD